MTNREQILRNTSVLFLERGCKSLTMDEVASANGMSKRTLYELFHDKAELLQECIYDFFTEVKKYYPEVFLNVVKDVNRWHCELLERIIEQGQKEGLFITGVLDAHSLSLQLFELSVAVTDRAVRNYLEIKHDSGSDCLMLFLIRGIASEKGRAYIDEYLENNKSMLK